MKNVPSTPEIEAVASAKVARRLGWRELGLLSVFPLALLAYGLVLRNRSAQKRPVAAQAWPRELVDLNRAVQARFAIVPGDGSFGPSRITSVEPLTASEKSALINLQKSNLTVIFYTAGRDLKRDDKGKITAERLVKMSWPLQLEGDLKANRRGHQDFIGWKKGALASLRPVAADVPDAREVALRLDGILENSRLENRQWKSGRWNVVAVPVAASATACVDCHNNLLQGASPYNGGVEPTASPSLGTFTPLRLGDTIGLAVYAYASVKKKQ